MSLIFQYGIARETYFQKLPQYYGNISKRLSSLQLIFSSHAQVKVHLKIYLKNIMCMNKQIFYFFKNNIHSSTLQIMFISNINESNISREKYNKNSRITDWILIPILHLKLNISLMKTMPLHDWMMFFIMELLPKH